MARRNHCPRAAGHGLRDLVRLEPAGRHLHGHRRRRPDLGARRLARPNRRSNGIHGPFLFGATDKLRPIFDEVQNLPETVVLRLRNMTAIDATGLRAFEQLAETLHRSGRHLVLCGARHQPAALIARADFHRHVGDANICKNLEQALNRAREIHNHTRVEPLPPAA